MAFLPYTELVKLVDAIADSFQSDGTFVATNMWRPDAPMKVVAFTSPDAFAMIELTSPDDPTDWVSIRIAGGGGLGARPEPALFQHLLLRSRSFDWGGPFATYHRDGTVTYGSHMTMSSSLVSQADPRDALAYIMDMIEVMGQSARVLATEALPRFGGALLNGSDPSHDSVLFGALLGPLPSDMIKHVNPNR